jgi:hypothetical protein
MFTRRAFGAVASAGRSKMKRSVTFIVILAAICSTSAAACGYHNPVDLARGVMNWVYPDSLHVRTAVWRAEDAGILPKRDAVKDLFAFRKTTRDLKMFGEFLARLEASPEELPAVSVVLLDSMLWSRLVRTQDGHDFHVHVDGPKPGDPVIVSDGKVITSLANGGLTGETAREHGLVSIYGSPEMISILTKAMNRLTVQSTR